MTKPERILLQTLLDPPRGNPELKRVARAVAEGAVFVYPTETIYGLGGVPSVKEKICSLKGRFSDQPMILIAPDRSFFAKLPLVFPPSAELLARKFWPGRLTLVVPSRGVQEGIALRVSGHPFIKALFRHCDVPIFSTSANLSGSTYVNDPEGIFSVFSGKIDFMIDAGPLPASLPSTVVRIGHDNTVTVLREGAVPSRLIVEALTMIAEQDNKKPEA